MINGLNAWVRELNSEINVLLDREARMWVQRSRIQQASQGDKNTKYFHSKATKRNRKNQICGIRDEQDSQRVGQEEISRIVTGYQQKLFTSTELDPPSIVLQHVPQVITEEMNQTLTCEFREEEVIVALKQMAPMKAPGPDGMLPLFFQHFQNIVDTDVTSSILSWLNTSILPHPLNHTFVALIPNNKNPEHVHQFCPIRLCNVLYKFFLKYQQTN